MIKDHFLNIEKKCLKSTFRAWKISHIVIYETRKNFYMQICNRRNVRKMFFTFISWQETIEKRIKFPIKYIETRLLRISLHNLRIFGILQILKRRLGVLCGIRKVYLQRGFAGWVRAWKKRNKISSAVHLLQNAINRFLARRALHQWPGWREYRKSEAMKMKILTGKRGRERLLGIIGFVEKERKREKEIEIEKEKDREKYYMINNASNHTLPILSSSSSSNSFIKKIKQNFSLAERIAIEATYLVLENSQKHRTTLHEENNSKSNSYSGDYCGVSDPSSYGEAFSLASLLLSQRIGWSTSEEQKNVRNVFDMRINGCDINNSIHNSITIDDSSKVKNMIKDKGISGININYYSSKNHNNINMISNDDKYKNSNNNNNSNNDNNNSDKKMNNDNDDNNNNDNNNNNNDNNSNNDRSEERRVGKECRT